MNPLITSGYLSAALVLFPVPQVFSAALESSSASSEVCMTAAQMARLSRLPVKKGCLLLKSTDRYCADPQCVGQAVAGDFDGDGRMDQAFTLQMSEPGEDDYWNIFASLSSYQVILRVSSDTQLRSESKSLLQTAPSPSYKKHKGWLITAGTMGETETYGFDAKKRTFTSTTDTDGSPHYAYPGLGLLLVLGSNSTFASVDTSGLPSGLTTSFLPWIGVQVGVRVDGYFKRYFSLESGLTWVTQSYKYSVGGVLNNGGVGTVVSGSATLSFSSLQLPIQIRYWPVPFISLGVGVIYSRAMGQVGCTASGALSCASSTEYSDAGLKSSYLAWIGTLGAKVRVSNHLWVVGDLSLIGTPNLVQDAAKAGTSRTSYMDFQSYGGIRYGFVKGKE